MPFNFNLKNTEIFCALKRQRFFLFRFARIFKNIFLILLIISFVLIGFSLFSLTSGYSAAKTLALFLSFYIIFWEFDAFTRIKIKNTTISLSLSDAVLNPDNYNLADFLSLQVAGMAEGAIKFCAKRKIIINSTSLFYSAVRASKEISIISFRLGLNVKKLETDLKNYLEKSQKSPQQKDPALATQDSVAAFSEDFQKTIKDALIIANGRGHSAIGEKEIFAALAKNDEFFKQVLVENDLKAEDIENITLWLDSAEDSADLSRKFWSKENLARSGSMGKDWASGYTITLDKFSIDWRKVVAKWRFREIIGHRKEINETEMILAKSNLSNVLIIGNTGSGRKSIIQALAQRCYLGQSLPELNSKRVVELDLIQLAAVMQDFEKLETTLDQMFLEVISSGNVILVIDNLENFVGQAVQKAGAVDVSGILSKYLAMPGFQFVGITTFEGLHKNIEQNPSFADLFRKVEVAEVSETETINILQTTALEAEYKHKILILYPSIREIVNLTARYMPSLPFPKKALDILDEAVVYVQSHKEKVVLPHHIAEIISEKTGIPVGKMAVKEKETLLNLENLIHQRIVNQEEAVKEISIAMRRARAGISSKTRPMGTFLFLGPTGVGKTETAKALAQIYFGSEKKMITLDMSEFQAISDIPRLVGATSPVEMQGLLTTPVRETPFSLVLLDEVEKAHPNILNLFLQVLDEGHITDGQGRKVVFTNTIIICTSNAGASMIFKQVESGEALEKDKLLDSLFDKSIFRPEFVNRFDATVIFHPLTKENLLKIAQLTLQGLQKNLKEKEINFEITDELKNKIVEMSYKPEFGAREMRRVVQDNIESAFAQALLSDKIKKGDSAQVNPENFELIINPPQS
jgi:ATP-dependent Clp protease ATP-binding subunit ClpC